MVIKMEKYQFIQTKDKRTRDFLKEHGFSEIKAPLGMYMFVFDKNIFTFAEERLTYSLTNNLLF